MRFEVLTCLGIMMVMAIRVHGARSRTFTGRANIVIFRLFFKLLFHFSTYIEFFQCMGEYLLYVN